MLQQNIVRDILSEVADTERIDIKRLCTQYGVTRQTVYRRIEVLKAERAIESKGKGRYALVHGEHRFEFDNNGLDEDIIWRNIAPSLPKMHVNAQRSLHYCFVEIMNNAIEHSDSSKIVVDIKISVYNTKIYIIDDGIGIFEKISRATGLSDKKFAVLELAKGKFTTEPKSHTGEGIFFSSKIANQFAIMSDNIRFVGAMGLEEPILFEEKEQQSGTVVFFEILNDSDTDMNEVFEKYTQQPEDFGFSKTQIPVKLLAYGEEETAFMSRSQARRLLARLEKFENIVLDFDGVDFIGQGFADEIFRVFACAHPNIKISAINCIDSVERMIKHALYNV